MSVARASFGRLPSILCLHRFSPPLRPLLHARPGADADAVQLLSPFVFLRRLADYRDLQRRRTRTIRVSRQKERRERFLRLIRNYHDGGKFHVFQINFALQLVLPRGGYSTSL